MRSILLGGGRSSLSLKHSWDMIKQINKNKKGEWIREQDKVYDVDGILGTLNKGDGSSQIPKILLKANTSSGEEIAKEGDSINYSQPNSKTRRGRVGVGVAQTLDTQVNQGVVIPVLTPDRPTKRQNGRRFKDDGDDAFTITSRDKHGVLLEGSIRRLTERECERLQGFPDDWTKMGNYDGLIKEISRTQRYKLCGNAVTVNIVELIGKRLLLMIPGTKK